MADSMKQGKAAAKELRKVHAIGSRILKTYPVEKNLGAAAIEDISREHGIQANKVQSYRQFAHRYSQNDLVKLCRLCEEFNWAPNFTTAVKLLMTIEDAKVRLAVTKLAAKENWSLTKLQTEIFRRQGRQRNWAGRRPRLPATPEEMIVELEAMCIRWRRLNQQLEQKPTPDNKQLVLGDLPTAIRTSFIKAVQSVGELEAAIERRHMSHR